MKPAFLIAGLSIFAHAFHIPVRPRAESCDEATAGEMAEGDDGPKTDGTTGIGVEFECPQLQIHPKDTENTPFNAKDGLKGRTIVGRQGDRFKLTVDGSGMANLQMEYILDGTAIKLGTGDADKVGAAAAQDLAIWKPWNHMNDDDLVVEVEGADPAVPWILNRKPNDLQEVLDLEWDAQITTAMPLEGIYSLMLNHNSNPRHPFDGRDDVTGLDQKTGKVKITTIAVKRDWFQANSNGIKQEELNDDVLGFCSLVMSFAKEAGPLSNDRNIKQAQGIMPRTDFSTLFEQVKSKLPGDLFSLFDSLACYATDISSQTTVNDTAFCSGSLDKPTSNGKFGALTYEKIFTDFSVNVKDWIQSIPAGSPDAMSKIDSSIGALRTTMETMLSSQRSVPIFEFRALVTVKSGDWEEYLGNIEKTIQDMHKQFAIAPQRKKRDDNVGSCAFNVSDSSDQPSIADSTTAAPGPTITCGYMDKTPHQPAGCSCESGSSTITVAPMTVPSASVITQSYDFSTWPGTQPSITAPPQTVTTNLASCEICTVVGANEDDCSPLPSSVGCIPARTSVIISAATSGVTIGTLTGSALYAAITSAVDRVCQVPPITAGGVGTFSCTESSIAVATNIKYANNVLGESNWDEDGTLNLEITEANYNSLVWYETSKSTLALMAQNSTQGNCKSEKAHRFPGQSKAKRDYDLPTVALEPLVADNMCQAASHYQFIETDPIANRTQELSFGLHFKRDPEGAIACDFLEGLVEFIETSLNAATDTEELTLGEFEIDAKLMEMCRNAISSA